MPPRSHYPQSASRLPLAVQRSAAHLSFPTRVPDRRWRSQAWSASDPWSPRGWSRPNSRHKGRPVARSRNCQQRRKLKIADVGGKFGHEWRHGSCDRADAVGIVDRLGKQGRQLGRQTGWRPVLRSDQLDLLDPQKVGHARCLTDHLGGSCHASSPTTSPFPLTCRFLLPISLAG